MTEPHNKRLLIESGILSDKEIEARADVELEKFIMKIQIESRVLGDLAQNHIVPTAIQYQSKLIENVVGLKEVFGEEYELVAGNRKDLIREISHHISSIKAKVKEMIETRKVCNIIDDPKEKAFAYDQKVKPFLEQVRYHIDKLELIVDDEIWPLPKYRELLFAK